MPAPAAAGAVVGVVGRLAGKKGAQAAAGAAAKEGAEEAVEGGAKAVAGKVQQGLAMVQANQQQAQQKKQNMQQRLQDATREGASTGSTIGKAILVKSNRNPFRVDSTNGVRTVTLSDGTEVEIPWLPQSSMEDAFDLGYPLIDYDDLHDKQRAIVDLISNKDNTRPMSYWDDPASGEFETEYYNMMFHPEKHHLYPDEAFDQYYRYLQHYYDASAKTRELPHSKQIEIMDAVPIHPEHPAEIAELKMAGEFSHDPVWTSANPHKAFNDKYRGLSKAVGVVKAQQTLDAFDHKKIEEAINPKSNTIIIASKPGSAEGMGSAQQSYLHNRLLAHLANLGKRAPNMNMITGVGRSKEWGNEHSITLSNVPHDLVDDIKELAHQFEQDSILHSPEGTTDALFAPPRGEATAGLRNPSLTQNTPSDYTQYPLGMNLTYADYFEKAVLVKERKSPEAMRHKREYDKKYESSPERVKYREDLNRERRRRGIYGSHDHMDVSHTEGGGLTLESQHANRGRHFKERGTLRPIAKSLREDLELLRNLLAGPMDEQDKKIGLAMVGMLEERHENDDDDDEEEKPKPKQTGFLSTLLR